MIIDRSYETMSSKERVLCAMSHTQPDRVPINYMSNAVIDSKLKSYFNIEQNDNAGLWDILGVDFRGLHTPYTGEPLHVSDRDDRIVDPQHGWVTRYVEHMSGGYWDYCDFPLIDAGEEEVALWQFPDPDSYDYDALTQSVKANANYALYLGNAGLGCIINTIGFLRGMEQVLVDLISDDPAGLMLIEKLMVYQLNKFERELDKVGKSIDFVWIGEDLGTQHTPLINKDIFHRHILPWHKKFIDMAAAYDLPAMMHTCGSSSWAYEDYIAAGLKGVDTLQPEATNMDPAYLKKTFGGRLFFHGCISTAGALAYGTAEEVVNDVCNTLEIMMPGSGYLLSPSHQIQDNSPVENVVAMYETAHKFGRY